MWDTAYYGGPWGMEYHGGSQKITIYYGGHGVLRGTAGILKRKKNFRFDTMRDTAYYGGPRGMEYHGGPRKTTIYYGGARHTTRDHREILLIFALSFDFYRKRKKFFGSTPWGDMAYYGGPPWSTTGDHGRPGFTMGGHGVIRGTKGKLKRKKIPVRYHEGTRRTTGDHGPWSTTGDHGRPHLLWGGTAYFGFFI